MPVILYNVPGRTGCNMLPPTVARIARDVPDVVGIKEATADLIHVSDLVEQCPEGFQILSGDDFTVLPHIAVGGCGVIGNDFHDRPDLRPNVCAVFVEPEHRCLGIAGQLLAFVCRDFHDRGIDTLYLLTDHDHFYERYGWTYHCPALGEGESVPSRLYRHVWQET